MTSSLPGITSLPGGTKREAKCSLGHFIDYLHLYFSVPEPVRFEDFAEFQLDIDRIMREHGMNPDDFKNGSSRTSLSGMLTFLFCFLVAYLLFIK